MRRAMRRTALLIASALLSAASAAAQDKSPEAFLESARLGVVKYADQAVAVREGYSPIGRDFPGMGEHWINIHLLFDGKFDAARPEILTYAVLSGKPKLLGVAYALPLLQGEHSPDWPAPPEAWHDHFRSLEDETVLPEHQSAGHAGDGPRITMLHAWIGLENPDGGFAADNWALPYARLGITPPEKAPLEAAKSLSLMTGGGEYFTLCIEALAPLNRAERTRISAEFSRARGRVEALLTDHSSALTPQQLMRLATIWSETWAAIETSVTAATRHHLQHFHIR